MLPIATAWILVVALALPAPSPASANGPTIGFDAGGIVPLANREIQLVHETVDLYLPLSDEYTPGRASCHYLLANHSSRERTFSMSFVAGYPSGFIEFEGSPPAAALLVDVRGKAVPVRMEKADRQRWVRFDVAVSDSLPVWEVTIPARDSAHVEIEYEIQWSGGSDGTSDARNLCYFARPAALWAGTIREATFRIHLGSLATALLRELPFNRDDGRVRLRVEPPDATWTSDALVWRRTNWEPDHDFRFLVDWDLDESIEE